jgi:hypothetical protein
MDKKKLRTWILGGILTDLLVVGLFCLQLFPFQVIDMKRLSREKAKNEAIYMESKEAPGIRGQVENELAALQRDLASFTWIHRVDPTPFLFRGLEEAGRISRVKIEKVIPLPPSFVGESGVTKLSWRVTAGASIPRLKRFFAALEPLPFLISGEKFSLVVKKGQGSQAQFTIFAFLRK